MNAGFRDLLNLVSFFFSVFFNNAIDKMLIIHYSNVRINYISLISAMVIWRKECERVELYLSNQITAW